MRNDTPSPEQTLREYFKRRHILRHDVECKRKDMEPHLFTNVRQEANKCLCQISFFNKYIDLILAHKDSIYISKQVMENLQEDAAWLEKVRAEAEAVLNS